MLRPMPQPRDVRVGGIAGSDYRDAVANIFIMETAYCCTFDGLPSLWAYRGIEGMPFIFGTENSVLMCLISFVIILIPRVLFAADNLFYWVCRFSSFRIHFMLLTVAKEASPYSRNNVNTLVYTLF